MDTYSNEMRVFAAIVFALAGIASVYYAASTTGAVQQLWMISALVNFLAAIWNALRSR